jgi:hypothetical protein
MFGLGPLRAAARSTRLGRTARKGETVRTNLLAILAMAFTLALAGPALAQDNPTTDAYGGVLGEEVANNDDTGGGGSTPTETVAVQQGVDDNGGSLPFTGLELGLVVLAGIGLVSLGLVMRRQTRRPTA